MTDQIWRLQVGSGPLVATAVHDGHELRDDVSRHMALSDAERLRQEDPFTGEWTRVAPTRVVGMRSRFEVDLNRPREKSVYRAPEDAWGLTVWNNDPPDDMFVESLAEYDAFYGAMRKLFNELSQQHGHFVVIDLHSYNHRRQGADGPVADPEGNPQVNIGTGTMNRERWAPVVDTLIETLRSFEFQGGRLDVRENVKFQGGNWPRWIHENFPDTGVAIAIEFKKFFMDEWTEAPNDALVEMIGEALQFTSPAVLDAFEEELVVGTLAKPIKVPDSGRAQHLHVVAGACSIQGARRDTNEDSQYISPDMDLFIVADGMGGHAAGEVASQFAVDVLSHEFANIAADTTPTEVEHRVHSALDRAHCVILNSQADNSGSRSPGTTVVFGLLVNHRLYITGVGDSRAYLVRGGSIDRLTIDDTWPDVLFHLGQISADEASRHSMRNMLVSALGMKDFDSNKEEIRAIDVYDGDRFLLASDGLTDMVDEARLLKIISENDNPQVAVELLTQEAVSNDAGDDVTCVVFYIQSDFRHAASASPQPTLWQRIKSLIRPK